VGNTSIIPSVEHHPVTGFTLVSKRKMPKKENFRCAQGAAISRTVGDKNPTLALEIIHISAMWKPFCIKNFRGFV
jgi:hypothetical protein